MSKKISINVLVVVEGIENYGVRKLLMAQYQASKYQAIRFRYVCLSPGVLCRNLISSGADVTIIGGWRPQTYPPNLFKVVSTFISHLKTNHTISKKIRTYLKDAKPDLVYTHNIILNSLAGKIAKLCRIKSVGHFHCALNTKRNWGMSRVLMGLWLNNCLDMGIAVSEAVRNSLWGPLKSKTCVIYNGFDFKEIMKLAEKLAIDKHCPCGDVVTVGRLVKIKKHHILLQAIEILKKQGQNLNLILVGGPTKSSNPYYCLLKKMAEKLGISNNVIFAGFIEKPYGIIKKARMSVLCHPDEGLGNVVLESMACKTPVIVPNTGGASELVDHGIDGLRFSSDDPRDLAQCIHILATDKNRANQYAENAYTKVTEKFSIENHMQLLQNKFLNLLNI